jgi:CPA2 family monovalent cation:H+ antiporter-2/glutathione-regulated potassium-efflux system protein KefB
VHEAFPKASIFVRAFDRRALLKLKGGSATAVVREVLESAIKMARLAMEAVGVDEEEIDRTETFYRQRDRERLKLQYEAGDLRAAREAITARPELGWRTQREKPEPLPSEEVLDEDRP